MIVHEKGPATFCFKKLNPENAEYGWCHTRSDYYDAKNPKKRTERRGWGYCSKDCYLDISETVATLRIADNVEVTLIEKDGLGGWFLSLDKKSH